MGKDRRKLPRLELNTEATVNSVTRASTQSTTAQTQNLSQGGAYLITEDPPEVGDELELQAGSGLGFRGNVIRVERLSAKRYGFALRFHPLHPEPKHDSKQEERLEFSKPARAFTLELKKVNEAAFNYYGQLRKVQEYVTQNYSEEIPLGKAARIAAMERTYFSTFFHSKVGVTFSSWLQYLRVRKAMELMKSGDHSITDVAFSVGFGDLRTFQRAFRKWASLAPRDFKKLVRPS